VSKYDTPVGEQPRGRFKTLPRNAGWAGNGKLRVPSWMSHKEEPMGPETKLDGTTSPMLTDPMVRKIATEPAAISRMGAEPAAMPPFSNEASTIPGPPREGPVLRSGTEPLFLMVPILCSESTPGRPVAGAV
jgi:hypothetical protein